VLDDLLLSVATVTFWDRGCWTAWRVDRVDGVG